MRGAVSITPAPAAGQHLARGGRASESSAADGEPAFAELLSKLGGDRSVMPADAEAAADRQDGERPHDGEQAMPPGVALLAALMAGGQPVATAGAGETGAAPDAAADLADQLRALAAAGGAQPVDGAPAAEAEQATQMPTLTVLRQEAHLAPASGPLVSEDDAGWDLQAPPLPISAPRGRNSDPSAAGRGSEGKEHAATAGEDGLAAGQSSYSTGDSIVASKEVAPAGQAPSPANQIGDRVVRDALGSAKAEMPAEPVATPARPAPISSAKVLHIELQPADLGTVTVRMTLRDHAIELRLDASREETARLLLKDRDRLSDILRSAGYQVDGLTVRVAEPDRTSQTSAGSQSFQNAGQSQPGSAHQDAGASGGQARTGRDTDNHRAASSNQGHETETANPPGDRLGGHLYV